MDRRFQLRVPLNIYRKLREVWRDLEELEINYYNVTAIELINLFKQGNNPLKEWLSEVDEDEYVYAVNNAAFMLDHPFEGGVRLEYCSEFLPGTNTLTNVPRSVIQHSPDGHNWGYGGSGPHDLALDILCQYFPLKEAKDEFTPGVNCYVGKCSETAWYLHHDLCKDLIAPLEQRSSHLIEKKVILNWLKEYKLKESPTFTG